MLSDCLWVLGPLICIHASRSRPAPCLSPEGTRDLPAREPRGCEGSIAYSSVKWKFIRGYTSGSIRYQRKSYDECRSAILTFAQCFNLAFVQLDEIAADGETEPKAAVAIESHCPLPVALEDARQGISRDSSAGIAHQELDRVFAASAVHIDVPPRGREADRIRQQVGYDLLDAICVDIDRSAIVFQNAADGDAFV